MKKKRDQGSLVDQCTETLSVLQYILDWTYDKNQNVLDDFDEDTTSRIIQYAEEHRTEEEARFTQILAATHYQIADTVLRTLITGGQNGARIERAIMLLLYLILKYQVDGIRARSRTIPGSKDTTVQDLMQATDGTLTELIYEFHGRLQDLIQGWRSLKLSVQIEVQCFAGGLFSSWYRDYTSPDSIIKEIVEEKWLGDDDGTPVAVPADAQTIPQLSKRVTDLDTRLARIEDSVARIMAALHIPAPTVTRSAQDETPADNQQDADIPPAQGEEGGSQARGADAVPEQDREEDGTQEEENTPPEEGKSEGAAGFRGGGNEEDVDDRAEGTYVGHESRGEQVDDDDDADNGDDGGANRDDEEGGRDDEEVGRDDEDSEAPDGDDEY